MVTPHWLTHYSTGSAHKAEQDGEFRRYMLCNYKDWDQEMFKENEIDINVLMNTLSERNVNYCDGTAYIMPESSSDGVDLLNEYAPDIRKDFIDMGVESIVVRGEKHNYFALRSADIILPLIFGIPFAVFANFVTKWIDSYLENGKVVRVKYIKQDGHKYKEIIIEGSGDEVKEILEHLKEH